MNPEEINSPTEDEDPKLPKDKLSSKELSLLSLQLEVWKTAVETQMHFNDMSAKARQHGIGLVVVIVGFALFLLSRTGTDYYVTLGCWDREIHISVLITLLPPFVLMAVMRLDLGVYHKMLRGAVKFGTNYEKYIMTKKIMKTRQGMTELITLYSRCEIVEPTKAKKKVTDKRIGQKFKGEKPITAEEKIKKVYHIAIICLFALPVMLFFLHP